MAMRRYTQVEKHIVLEDEQKTAAARIASLKSRPDLDEDQVKDLRKASRVISESRLAD